VSPRVPEANRATRRVGKAATTLLGGDDMAIKLRTWRVALLTGCATMALATAMPAAASAEGPARNYAIESQALGEALRAFAMTSGHDVVFDPALVQGRTTAGVKGAVSDEAALRALLDGTNLAFEQTASGGFVVRQPRFRAADSQASGGGNEVEALIVTAQKREEDIQDVPIAISAFSQEDLTRSQIAGGPDLITQVPNMTFTKTNFSSYSIQLRGIGTQAISATTDPAVAVAFNNTPFIRNRFFEQEFYDLARVEVLRGPQGTLYGRNATAGVVNIISQKPKFVAEAKLSGDIGNFNSSRVEGMVNIPLVEDKVALRLAGAWTKRDGYATNELTGNPIDGRDLWSTRLSLRVSPSDRLDMNLIWEHFEEDDDRLRSGKQLCKKDVITTIAGFDVGAITTPEGAHLWYALPNKGQGGGGGYFGGVNPISFLATADTNYSQGCVRESLYSPDSFQTPNGLMLPYYMPLSALGLPVALGDPYLSATQSHDLRAIESTVDPDYRAEADIGELQVSLDLTDSLTLSSETAYGRDFVYSLQDFNRFNTSPGAWAAPDTDDSIGPADREDLLTLGPNGTYVFCDPQLGCADRLVAVDLATATASQFSQEFRLASDFEGPFNFSLGANYLRADSEDKYYVFINSLSLYIAKGPYYRGDAPAVPYVRGESDNSECLARGYQEGNPSGVYSVVGCTYIDPNPIGSLNDRGHNYFLSKNPYKLISYAVFGEAYYEVTDALKVTAGLRWTVDKKDAPRIPTWIAVSQTVGYPVAEVIEQEWREPTGRLAVDWKPDLAFTDETMIYGSYAHGYKAGGANPPGYVRALYASREDLSNRASATRPRIFDAEFIDAFEVGAKNVFADGKVTMNLAAFYYDYKDYQISEIVDRSAFNRNFDATVWGIEWETDWRPLENLRLGFKGGYEKTRIADHEQAIDLMDRTAGDPAWIVVRPFPTYASSCILPAWVAVGQSDANSVGNPQLVLVGGLPGGTPTACELAYALGVDPVTERDYIPNPPDNWVYDTTHLAPINYPGWSTDPAMYPGLVWPGGVVGSTAYPGWDPMTAPNGGEGIMKPLGGNELPNAPQWTATITADYTLPLPNDWLATLHTDLHWQAESWWRVFNDHEYNKLDEYFTMNLAAIFTNEERGWNIMAYIKNVTDETAITGAFLNSDDTGLTTNVFLTEPRLYGLRVTKAWTGGPLLGTFGANREGPFPFTVELGGQVQRHDAPNETLEPEAAGVFDGPLAIFDEAQAADLDRGDGRDMKVTWRPSDGPMSLAAQIRVGKTNFGSRASAQEQVGPFCVVADPDYCTALAGDPKYEPLTRVTEVNNVDAVTFDREEHTIIDFKVGYDLGLGSLEESTLAAGLRYASLTSDTDASLYGIPDWSITEGFYSTGVPVSRTLYNIDVAAQREFKGWGPVLSWDAALPLLGSSETGRLALDWSVQAGVLFGQQRVNTTTDVMIRETTIASDVYLYELMGVLANPVYFPHTTTVVPAVVQQRSENATVPVAGGALGLSYKVGGFKMGAGYRWERYFDAIDGGYEEHRSYDRTIDGPYFKIAVGFGG
jgi:outer membrane receptor protein involved in Fe transport